MWWCGIHGNISSAGKIWACFEDMHIPSLLLYARLWPQVSIVAALFFCMHPLYMKLPSQSLRSCFFPSLDAAVSSCQITNFSTKLTVDTKHKPINKHSVCLFRFCLLSCTVFDQHYRHKCTWRGGRVERGESEKEPEEDDYYCIQCAHLTHTHARNTTDTNAPGEEEE